MTRIVDLAGPAGFYAGKLFADQGAEVIRVEPPGGDPIRAMPPHLDGVDAPESSLWWAYFAAGKKSAVVDSGDADTLDRLVASADVVIESAGPGVHDFSGHESLVWVAISPFGRSGPRRDWKTSNLVAWALSGVLYTTGFDDMPPVVPGGPALLACHTTSLNAAAGAMLALRARKRTGRGQLVDISIHEVMVAVAPEVSAPVFMDDLVPRPRQGNRRPITRPWGLYPAKDGYVSIMCIMPAHWAAFAQWVNEETGNEGVIDEVFNDMRIRWEASEAVDAWAEELAAMFTKRELFIEGQRRGIPITPVNTAADLNADPHLAATGFFADIDHPALGTLRMPTAPVRLGHDRPAPTRAPLLDEHTDEVLSTLP